MISADETGMYPVEIDGQKYHFEKWGADDALDVILELVPLVGGPIGAAIKAVFAGDKEEAKSILDKKLDADAVATVFTALSSNFNKKMVKDLVINLTSKKVLCDGRPVVFRTHYQDRLAHMFKVSKAALEVQYGPFFDDIRGLLGAFKPIMAGIRNREM